MLQRISVRNFILIEKLDIEFSTGLCAITGETGAGKSILIDSLLFCLNGRFNSSVIRQGAEIAIVTAEFSINEEIKTFLLEHDIEVEDTVIIKRNHNLKNQKKFSINDTPVTQKLVTDVANLLVDYHGQNLHNYLEDSSSHQRILDSYAKLTDTVAKVSEKYKNWKTLESELNQITVKRTQIEEEKSYLEFVVEELERAAIEKGEEEKLSNLRALLQQQAKYQNLISETLSLMENQNFESKIMQMQKSLSRAQENQKFETVLELLNQALINYQEAKDVLSSISSSSNTDYHNLEETEERLFTIRGLARKYNTTADSLIDVLAESKSSLQNINDKLESSDLLKEKLEQAREEYLNQAQQLSKKRQEAATLLESGINEELKALKMEKAIFKVEISNLTINDARATGINNIRFLASTNPGTPFAPIDKIASGGELSRLMLAFKVIIHDSYPLPTMVFDEIDTGLGGAVASLVGDRLKKLSNKSQVITITHQPQVAGMADQHILVQKHQTHSYTEIRIKSLSKEERVNEIARMLSGKEVTKAAIDAAYELMVD